MVLLTGLYTCGDVQHQNGKVEAACLSSSGSPPVEGGLCRL